MEFNATFTVVLVSFVGFMLAMRQLFFEPIRRIKAAREAETTHAVTEAESLAQQAEALSANYAQQLTEARQQAQQLVATTRQDALTQAQQQRDGAKAQAAKDLASHVAQLETQAQAIQTELSADFAQFAEAIVANVHNANRQPAMVS